MLVGNAQLEEREREKEAKREKKRQEKEKKRKIEEALVWAGEGCIKEAQASRMLGRLLFEVLAPGPCLQCKGPCGHVG